MYKVFISNSRRDHAIADLVVSALNSAGIPYVRNQYGMESNEADEMRNRKAIDGCQIFLCILSENAYAAEYVKKDILYALENKERFVILPIITDNSFLPKDWESFNLDYKRADEKNIGEIVVNWINQSELEQHHIHKKYKYFAFISYKRGNLDWAQWFQSELENYSLPTKVIEDHKGLPDDFRPVFRDVSELKSGCLTEQIEQALDDSLNLVVICSPLLAKDEDAKWVNQEISYFMERGLKGIADEEAKEKRKDENIRHIFPFIVDGKPHSGDVKTECFPKALRDLSDRQDRVGGNVNEGGDVNEKENRDMAFVKVLAGMLDGVRFSELWDRYAHEKIKRENEEREQKEKLQISQSRFLAEKANQLVDEGDSYLARLLLLKVLPNDSADYPYTLEAENAFRKAMQYNNAVLRGHTSYVASAAFSPDGKRIVSASRDHTVRIWDAQTGKQIGDPLEGHADCVASAAFSPDGKRIVSASWDHTVRIWDAQTGKPIDIPLNGHTDLVCPAAFSPDGRRIVLASRDHTVRIGDFPPLEDLIKQTCERFTNRQLTPEERRKYYLE